MKFKCQFCDGTKCALIDGWYYCSECNRQLYQEFEFDAFEHAPDTKLKKTKIKDKSLQEKTVKDQHELTTWEGFNYILHGLTEELINLGVTPAIKLTVFQLWTEYLRKTETAFFSLDRPALPKLPTSFTRRDADILYNHKRRMQKRKLKKSSEAPSVSSGKAKRRKLTKLIDQSQNSQHESILDQSKSDLHATLDSLADLSASEIQSISGKSGISSASSMSIEFSRSARKSMKKYMPKKHIETHANDLYGAIKCHRKAWAESTEKERGLILTRNFLFAILFCALQYHGEIIQIGDLVRFCRERHISFHSAKHFLPRDALQTDIDEINLKYSAKNNDVFTRDQFEDRVPIIRDFLNVELQVPNIYALCERYVEELCLPVQFGKYIERIIAICEPTMNYEAEKVRNNDTMLPCHEGRAMAYIIFLLKLWFGLNDVSETQMSESAKSVNALLQKLNIKTSALFVWSEWVEYIEARKILLSKYHSPSYFYTGAGTDNKSTAQYLNILKEKVSPVMEEYSDLQEEKHVENPNTKTVRRREEMREITKHLLQEHNPNEPYFIEFPPSLTPQKTYMEIIREQYADKIHIPSILLKDHTNRDVDAYLEPLNVYNLLLSHRIKLEVTEAELNPTFKFVGWNKLEFDSYWCKKFSVVNLNTNSAKWEKNVKKSQEEYENSLKAEADTVHESRKAKFERLQKKRLVKNILRTTSNQQELFQLADCDSKSLFDSIQDSMVPTPQPDEHDSSISLKTPNFQYWTHFCHSSALWHEPRFVVCDEVLRNLPRSFIWLLKHCAKVIEAKEGELYRELMTIEAQFLYALKPMDRMTSKLSYRKFKKLPSEMRCAIKHYSSHF